MGEEERRRRGREEGTQEEREKGEEGRGRKYRPFPNPAIPLPNLPSY